MTYWLFGYGSLIWKAPPHVVERVPGHIEGYVRRFWQSSNDHRGTPAAPGRVATLITKQFWAELADPHPYGHDDVVWGVAYRIDEAHAAEVKEYMDYREKNGYTEMDIKFTPADGRAPFTCTTYVGLPTNPAFVGAQDPEALARHIVRSHGPSGPNKDYLYHLHDALQALAPDSEDRHISDLVARARRIEATEGGGVAAPAVGPTAAADPASRADTPK